MSFQLCSAAIFAALLAAGPLWAATAYVSNEGSGTVSIIDTTTDKVLSTGSFARKPRGIAISKDGARLYLSDQTANALVVVDTANRQVVATIALGDSPEAIYVSPDGKWLSAAIE
jgi:YVTN family beta-propeller protein